MKKHDTKLSLTRQTLRQLDETRLDRVLAGTGCSMNAACDYRSAAVNCEKVTICPDA